jgi:hypothetical protein
MIILNPLCHIPCTAIQSCFFFHTKYPIRVEAVIRILVLIGLDLIPIQALRSYSYSSYCHSVLGAELISILFSRLDCFCSSSASLCSTGTIVQHICTAFKRQLPILVQQHLFRFVSFLQSSNHSMHALALKIVGFM